MFKRGEASDLVTGQEWIGLIGQGIEKARELGAETLMIRVLNAFDSAEFGAGLRNFGFAPTDERIEFRATLASLPPPGDGSPLTWRTRRGAGGS